MRIILISVLFIPFIIFSQGYYQDFGSWTKSKFNFKVNKDLSLRNKTELRTNENAKEINQFYTQFSIKKKFNKHISNSIAYRIKSMNREFGYITENRFHHDFTYKTKLKDLSFYIRFRTQYNIIPNELNELYERTRFKINIKLNKKIKIYWYDEFFFKILHMQNDVTHNKNRMGTGIEFKLNKKLDLEFKYLRIKEISIENPRIMNVLGSVISFNF